jgi:hypothetical protein
MTLQPLPSGFPYIRGKFSFLLNQCTHHKEQIQTYFLPPPLVRRCNGTTAGLGYWKVGLEWPYNTPPGQ